MGKKVDVKEPVFTSVERNGKKITFQWKKGQSDYVDINAKWKEFLTGEADDMHKLPDSKVGKNTTKKTVTLDWDNYNPKKNTKLDSLRMMIQGEIKKNGKTYKSNWVRKKYDAKKPDVTTPSWALGTTWNEKVFSWNSYNADGKDDDHTCHIRTEFQYATKLVPRGVNASNVPWSYNTTKNKTWTCTETQGVGANVYSRYFAVRARGPQGDSGWKYADPYVYAYPNKGVVSSATATNLGTSYRIDVRYSVNTEGGARPYEKIDIEYAIETPITSSHIDSSGNRILDVQDPSSFSWQMGKEYAARSGSDSFIISSPSLVDKRIYVRIVTTHNGMPSSTYGDSFAVSNGYGVLTSPSEMSYEVNSSYLATINSIKNNSAMTASYVAIYFRTNLEPKGKMVGVWPAGNSAAINVQLPDPGTTTNYSLGMRTFLSNYSPAIPKASGVTLYTQSGVVAASSGIIWDDRPVPKQPKINVTPVQEGTVRIEWDYKWTDANGMELAWADHEDAWESTEGPTTYTVSGTTANAWNITNLAYGEWWFRVRAFLTDGTSTTYGTPSDIFPLTLSSSPKPSLTISPEVVHPDSSIACYWAYTGSGDGDSQLKAEIREVTIGNEGEIIKGAILGSTEDDQSIILKVSDLGWEPNSTHYISVRTVTAYSGAGDYMSIPKLIRVLPPVEATITDTSLVNIPVVIDDETGVTENKLSLVEMPLTVEASGTSSDGFMTFIIERDGSFIGGRPDENDEFGFDGEIIGHQRVSPTNIYELSTDTSVVTDTAYYQRTGSGTEEDPYVYTPVTPSGSENPSSEGWYESIGYTFKTTFTNEDLYSYFDDGARYSLIAIAEDAYGYTSDESARVDFQVNWTRRAVIPEAEIEVDETNNVVFITPISPETPQSGDVCDIYRLSIDKPELIIRGATFGEKYVDIYPVLGSFGGHRIVYRTIDGDCYTQNGEPAWRDYGSDYEDETDDIINLFATVINYENESIILPYDLSLSTKWAKDFIETKYLGGAVQGDWNPAISRTGSVNTRIAVQEDSELIEQMRRLAVYAGVCHVRTPDGSSYAANVNVTEDREEKKINMVASFSLEITRVDSVGFEGMPYNSWINTTT